MLSFIGNTYRKIIKMRPLIGNYEFWVLLTYMSVVSAVFGIYFALFTDDIMYAIICLMVSGICDTFDGRVASLKKRNDSEKSYGIQIDAMADLISFGVLPAVIGYAVGRQTQNDWGYWAVAISAAFVLGALIRLAHFNVRETESLGRNEKQRNFEGVPTTSVALLIPIIYSVCNMIDGASFYTAHYVMMAVVSVLFVVRIKIPKPRKKGQIILCLVGIPLVIYLFYASFFSNGGGI